MVTGSCLCGTVRYEITGRISPIVFCHCSKCRKANGSAFHAGALCRKTKFRFTAGTEAASRYRSPSGYSTCFCSRCGSPVPMHQDDGEYVVLPSGGLDQDPGARPFCHIFVGSKSAWFEITDALPQFPEHGEAGAS